MKKHFTKLIPALAVLSLAAGCGKDSSSGGHKNSGTNATVPSLEESAPMDGSNIKGLYQAKFTTLNPQVNGTIPGSATFFRKDDRLFAYIRLFAGGPKAWHMQYVYDGNRCPTPADDTNGDGFIDIQEAEAVTGKILIPMDSDLSNQSSGKRFFPLGDLSGYYYYERVTSFRSFLNDLMDADRDPTDDMVKLPPGQGLRLEGKVFMVMGVADSVVLPDTVATKDKRRSFQTLPVACGVYQKADDIPGTVFVEGEIPGPVATVDPNQDRPATETIPDSPTGGTTGSGRGSGTNSSEDGDGPMSDGGSTRTTGGSTSGNSTTGSSTTGTSTTGSSTTTGSDSHRSTGTTTGGTSTSGSSTDGSTVGGMTSGGSTTGDTSTGTTDSSTTSASSSTSTSSTSSSTSSSSTGGTTGGIFGF